MAPKGRGCPAEPRRAADRRWPSSSRSCATTCVLNQPVRFGDQRGGALGRRRRRAHRRSLAAGRGCAIRRDDARDAVRVPAAAVMLSGAAGVPAGSSARSALRITATSISLLKDGAPAPASASRAPRPAWRASKGPCPTTMLCERDGAGAPRDDDRLGDPIEAVDENDHIGGFRGGAGAARAQGDPDIGRGQRRRIVDAVADHEGRMQPLLGAHRIDLVGGHAVRRARASRSSAAPIVSAASARSPVTITMRATPASRSRRIARGVSARSSSPSSSAPTVRPSTATNTIERRAPGGAPQRPRLPIRAPRSPRKDQFARAARSHAVRRSRPPARSPWIPVTCSGSSSCKAALGRGLERWRWRRRDATPARASRRASTPRRRFRRAPPRRRSAARRRPSACRSCRT